MKWTMIGHYVWCTSKNIWKTQHKKLLPTHTEFMHLSELPTIIIMYKNKPQYKMTLEYKNWQCRLLCACELLRFRVQVGGILPRIPYSKVHLAVQLWRNNVQCPSASKVHPPTSNVSMAKVDGQWSVASWSPSQNTHRSYAYCWSNVILN